MAQPDTAAATDLGRVRRRNEDTFLVDPALRLLVVADGMGGHPAGDVASRLAAAELRDRLDGLGPLPSFIPPEPGSLSPMGLRMAEGVRHADARIRAEGAADEARAQMGTTLTALVTHPDGARATLVHVGDSRAYLYDNGRLRQLTRDHTWVQEQIARGALSAAEARGHPWAHMLVQALGVGEDVEPEILDLETRSGQVYLLCTDGLTTMLPDAAMERGLQDALPRGLDAAARALVDAANDQGGLDNITVVLLRL